jgi:arabinofuranan 3-O-arabinosyltransferase
VNALVAASVLLLNLAQQPGKITFDTKLDLQFAPADFLLRSLELWNAGSAVGGLQNQASGYLFPMGPSFLLGELLGVPMWVWERLWSAGVMLLAYEGMRRLAASWPGMSVHGAVLAGLAYMLAPRVLTTVGGLSGETLPAAVLPWTLLPLVHYLFGRWRRGTAFVVSAATVPWMGGQNATLVVACMILPALFLGLAEGRDRRRRVTDLAAWGSLVVLASLWWLVPLFLLGAYAPPFLDFIESAENTASSIGWLSSFRGTSHWVAFFPDGGSVGWQGGYVLASSTWLLVTTIAVAGIGLLGLVRSDLRFGRVLVASVVVGLALLTAGSGGWAGSPLSEAWLRALDTFLAPVRNVHKFDPLVRLPVSLGVGAVVSGGVFRLPGSFGLLTSRRRPSLLLAFVTAVIVAGALPMLSGELRPSGGMRSISPAWVRAVDYLDSTPGPVRVLVLPGSGFAVQSWGRTIDEPIQVLGAPAWVARAQVTVAPASTLRLMDSIEQRLGKGRPDPGMAALLRRLGITHVLVRNDLDPAETDAPSPAIVHASMQGATGVTRVTGFGSAPDGRSAVEVFAVDGPQDRRTALLAWGDRAVIQGGPEVVDNLVATGMLDESQPTVLAGSDRDRDLDVVTDSNQRVERSFGRVHSAVSGVMTAQDEFRVDRPVHDYTGGAVPARMTVAEYDGAAQIVASTSAGYADTLGAVRPESHPYAAFDDSIFTAWASAPFTEPVGQWLEVRFERPVRLSAADLRFDPVSGADITTVRLGTEGGTRTVPVGEGGSAREEDLPEEPTSFLRMSVVGAVGATKQVRLNDLRLQGHPIRRSLRLPGQVSADTFVYMHSDTPRRACRLPQARVSCDLASQTQTPETPGFQRIFSVSESGEWHLRGRAIATDGPHLELLLDPLSDRLVKLRASTTFAGDPAVVAANAFDGRPDTSWLAATTDPAPAVELSWRQPRTITKIVAALTPGLPGSLPKKIVVDPLGDGPTQVVKTRGPAAGEMVPVRTTRIRLSAVVGPETADEGVGISELDISGLNDLRYTPDLRSRTGVLCGFGPTVAVGNRTIQTRLSGTLADVVTGQPLEVISCGSRRTPLQLGDQRLRVTNPAGFSVSELWLEPVDTPSKASSELPSRVTSWSATRRSVAVSSERESVLVIPESYNKGWKAHIDDATLPAVVVDGWKQGWRVPAGTDAAVQLVYEPQERFIVGLLLGLFAAVALQGVALVALIRRRRSRRRTHRGERPVPSVPSEQRANAARSVDSRHPRRLVVAGGALLLFLVSVPFAVGAILGRTLFRRSDAWVIATSGVALTLAAMLVVTQGSALVPPAASDLLVAFAVGLAAARVIGPAR